MAAALNSLNTSIARWLAAAAMLVTIIAASAEPLAPVDIKVSDGDTIKALGRTVRLVGFDTPEIGR
jgi:endonuclease YncB( thermonuclease family)